MTVTGNVVSSSFTGIDATSDIVSGILPTSRGGAGEVVASGTVVLSTGSTLSNLIFQTQLTVGNSSISDPGNGVLGIHIANVTTSGMTIAGSLSATTYSGNGYGLSSLNIANIGTTTGTGNVVLSEGPSLTNMIAKNTLYLGNLASNTAVTGGDTLGFRANGVTIATMTTSGLDVTGTMSGNAVTLTSSAQTVLQTTVSTSYGAWTSRTNAVDIGWRSVCYGNGLYVAVSGNYGTGNRVMTSPDGITWTSRTSAADNSWVSVCYGNGLFVAVSQDGSSVNRVMTSPDGITWTIRTSAAGTNSWQEVCYGNGLFVAVSNSGTGNRVMTSPDGITWTARTSAADNAWYGVCYGNGLFVAVPSYAIDVMTSPDGITWTSRTSAAANGWSGVCFGNGLFVAVATSGQVMTSPDGITWTSRTSAANNDWAHVCYGNTKFVAVGLDGIRVMSSTDGITWTSESAAANNSWWSACWGADKFVAVSNDGTGNRVMTSTYLITPSLGLGRTAGTAYQLDLSLDTARKLTSTTWTTGSDRRIKEDIEDANLEMCCDVVNSIPLKRFAWKASYAPTQTDRHQLGWIAQDVEAAGLEKAVTISEDHGYPDFRSLNTDQLYKIMWGALQKHMMDVKDIEERLQE